MALKHKLLKDMGGRLFIDVPSINKQLKDTFIIILSVFIIIVVLYFMRIYEKGNPIPFEPIILAIVAISIFGVFVFGFRKKYIFDLNRKQVTLEGSNFFVPYQKVICSFDKIATFGIKAKIERRRRRQGREIIRYYYCLVFSTKDKPNEFIELVSTINISYEINLNDLNELGKSLADILKCSFIEGQEYMTIVKVNNEFKNVMLKR